MGVAVVTLDQAAAIVFCFGIAFGLAVAVASVRLAQRDIPRPKERRRA